MNDVCNETSIRALLLHAEKMVLWQAVERWDSNAIECRTLTHQDVTQPLRRDGVLSAIHLAEYGAQLMAIHGALLAKANSSGALPAGVLTSLRDFKMNCVRIDDINGPLHGSARQLVSGASGSIYDFSISADALLLASGRISVMTLPQDSSAT